MKKIIIKLYRKVKNIYNDEVKGMYYETYNLLDKRNSDTLKQDIKELKEKNIDIKIEIESNKIMKEKLESKFGLCNFIIKKELKKEYEKINKIIQKYNIKENVSNIINDIIKFNLTIRQNKINIIKEEIKKTQDNNEKEKLKKELKLGEERN